MELHWDRGGEGRGGGEEGRGSNFHQHFSGHLTAIAWEIADAGFVLLPELRSWDVMGIQLVNVVRRAVCTTLDSVFRFEVKCPTLQQTASRSTLRAVTPNSPPAPVSALLMDGEAHEAFTYRRNFKYTFGQFLAPHIEVSVNHFNYCDTGVFCWLVFCVRDVQGTQLFF